MTLSTLPSAALFPDRISSIPTCSPDANASRETADDVRRIISYAEALREATVQEMERDPRIIVMGQGVDDFKGFYGTTLGLAERFGRQRVFDLPLSEEGTMGI